MRIFVPKSKGIKGSPPVGGDKSVSQRAVMLGSIFPGVLSVKNINSGEDVAVSIQAMRDLGREILIDGNMLYLHGGDNFIPKKDLIWLDGAGNPGRVIFGLLSSIPTPLTVDGNDVLRKRSMQRIKKPLTLMGAKFSESEYLPITITGTSSLKGIEYTLPTGCAQTKTAILIAALFADGKTTIHQPILSRTHTEDMLEAWGYPLERSGGTISLYGKQFPPACNRALTIDNDPSSAAFWLVGALLIPNSEIVIANIANDPFRMGFVEVLKRMGGNIHYENRCIFARTSALHAIEVEASMAPSLIDEYPIIFVAASLANGISVFHGLKELRYKESNRLEGMRDFLVSLGVRAWCEEDSMFIEGNPNLSFSNSMIIDCACDHRIAMALSILGSACRGITMQNCEAVSMSFPGFFAYLGA